MSCLSEPFNMYWGWPYYRYLFYESYNPQYQVACYNTSSGECLNIMGRLGFGRWPVEGHSLKKGRSSHPMRYLSLCRD